MREHNTGNFYDQKKLSHAIQALAWLSQCLDGLCWGQSTALGHLIQNVTVLQVHGRHRRLFLCKYFLAIECKIYTVHFQADFQVQIVENEIVD